MHFDSPKARILLRVKLMKLRYLVRRSPLAPIFCLIERLSRRVLASIAVGLVAIGVALAVLLSSPGIANAVTVNLGSSDLLEGVTPFGEVALSGNSMQLQNGVVGKWNNTTGLQNVPSMENGVSNLVYGPNDTLYLMISFGSNCHFRRYDIERKQWESLRTPPMGCGTGNVMVSDGQSSIYFAPGVSSGRFFRYDIASDQWNELAAHSANIGDISSAAFVTQGPDQYVYLFRGLSSPSFWRYAVGSNTWQSMAPFPASSNVNNGIAMTWDGADNIYALSNDVGEFKRYSVSTNNWTSLTNLSNSCNRASIQFANGKIFANRVGWCAGDLVTARVYTVATATWANMTPPPVAGANYDNVPPVAYDGSRYAYVMHQAEHRPYMVRLDTTTSLWDEPSLFTPDLENTMYHYRMIYDGANGAYYFAGQFNGNYDRVYKYDLTTKQATRVGSQINTTSGYAGAYSGGFLYLLPSSGNTTFQRYDVSNGVMTPLAALPFATANGMDIVDGGNGNLYVTFGNRTNFYRYNIAGNTWTSLAAIPNTTGAGASFTRIGTNLYLLVGNTSGNFVRYDINTNIWSSVQGMPEGSVDWGAFLSSDSTRYLYVGVSSRIEATARKFYRYDTQTSTWQRLADLPASTQPYASSFFDVANNKLYVGQGQASAKIWDWSPGTTNLVTGGTWYSKTYDLKQVQSWTALDSTIGGTGTTEIYTRTSPDGRVWSSWQLVSGSTISSPTNRYAQIKVALSGNGTSTPTVSDLGIRYTQETNAPGLPSVFSARGEKNGATISSGQSYEYRHPYFSWEPSSDGANGSGVAGYYVYYGIDSGADPLTDGNFQTSTEYTATSPMTAGDIYYLRIAVKDNLGNTSPAATFFSYRYFYISPPSAIVQTSSSDFSSGVNSNVNISNGSMQLPQQPAGSWSTGPMEMLPENVRGAASAVVDDYLYVARGAGTTTFWRYNLVSQTWETLATAPAGVNTGSSMSYDGGNFLYLVRGAGTNSFYRYDIQNNDWTTLVNLPSNAQPGTDITYIGNNQFAIMYGGVREFYFFDASSNNFTGKQTYPVSSINDAGAGLWYDGQDTIYAYQGGTTWWIDRSRAGMAKYSISTDTWKTLANPPVIATFDQNNLVSDGRGGLYIFTNNTSDNLSRNQRAMRYDIAADSWDEVRGLNSQMMWGSATSDGKRFIYLLPSEDNNVRKIIRFDTWDRVFTPTNPGADAMDRTPWDSHTNAWAWMGGTATTAAYDGTKWLYAIGGSEGNFSRFLKFDPKTGETIYLPPPVSVGASGSLTFLNGKLYYVNARGLRDFYRFEESAQQWVRMGDLPNTSTRPGPSSAVAAGGSIYVPRGNSNAYYKYTPDGGLGTWQTMTNAPGTINHGAAAYDSANGYIYYVAGNNTTNFYRYNIAGNSWSSLASLPSASNLGATAVLHNGKIYAQLGNSTKTAYVYDISGNSWSNGTDAPELFRQGSHVIDMGTHALALAGDGSPDFWQFNYPGNNTAYSGLGTHISQPSEIAGIFDYANVTAQVSLPANTKVELYTRTSADGNTWDDWAIADEVKIYQSQLSGRVTSTVQKFIQMKVVLTSLDNVSTPTVDSYAVNYYFDVDAPLNPGTFKSYSDVTKTTELNNSTWYNHSAPVFDWPEPGQPGGATDGPLGSRIAGYWVYVGTDPTASPRTAGVFVPASEYSPALTIPGTYYVRMQTQDFAGNIDGTVFAPFAYKFDNQAPTSPALISVTPSGYTTQNNFSFNWPASTDGHAGVAGYCYHSGATSGPFAVEVCQPGRTLDNVSIAYTTGTNVFYVRTYDNAGNYSPSYTTVSYYYATDPPGPVANLRAIPPSSPDNIFAFTWDLPTVYSGDPDQLTYCYSVNALPTPLNTTCTADRFVAPFKAGTQQGANIMYMVAKDEARNADWTNFAFANFTANTVSPGMPVNLVAADTSDRASKRFSITTTWDAPELTGNGIAKYVIERSEDGHKFTEVGATSARAYVDLAVLPNVNYFYRVRAADSVDNRGGPSSIVSKSAQGNYTEPPGFASAPKATADSNQAKISWATSRASTSFVYYGTSPADLTQSKGALELTADHSMLLTGLQPATTYYYRVQSFDNDRTYALQEAYSTISSFTTREAARTFNVSSSSATLDSVLLSWQTTAPTKSRIEYGGSAAYGLSVIDGGQYTTNHNLKLSGLESGTGYHFRIIGTTEIGTTIYSDDYTFSTIARPVITGVQFQSKDEGASQAVEVVWNTNVPTSSTVKYSAPGDDREVSSSDFVTRHSITVRDLASASEYSFLIEGRDKYGNLATSGNQTWRSDVDTRPATISDVSISVSTIAGTNGQKAQMIVIWNTDEPSTTQVEYGTMASGKMDKSTPLDTEPTTNHIAIISGLNLADIYQVQFSSKDLSGNTSYSSKTLVVTPDKQESLLDRTLNLMLGAFRF